MKMNDRQLQVVISDGLGFTQDEKEMLERALYRVDHIDRRQKVERKGFFEKVIVKKYIFKSEYADQKYRDFEEKIFRKMVYDFFKSPEAQIIDDLFDKMNRGKGYITGYQCGLITFGWKQKHLKQIMNDTVKEMKRA